MEQGFMQQKLRNSSSTLRSSTRRRTCPHCEQEFGARALAYHIKSCKSNTSKGAGGRGGAGAGREPEMEDGGVQACPHCAVPFHPAHMQVHLKQCSAEDLEVHEVSPLRQLSPISPLIRSRNNEQYFKDLELQDLDARLKAPDGQPKAAPSGLPRRGVQTYRAPQTEALLSASERDTLERPGASSGITTTKASSGVTEAPKEHDESLSSSLQRLLAHGYGGAARARASRRARTGRQQSAAAAEDAAQVAGEAETMSVDNPKGSFQGSFNRAPRRRGNQQRMNSQSFNMPVDGHSDEKGSNFQRIEEADGKEKERQQESLKAAIEPSSGLLSAGGQSLDTPQPEEAAVPRQRPTHWMDNVPIRVVQLAQIPEAVQEAYPVDPPLSQIPEHVDAVEMRKCPYCTRSFRAAVAARHIPKCEYARSRPKPPPKTADLVEKKIQRRLQQQRTTKILSNSHEKSDGSPRTSSKKKKQAQKEAEPGIQLIEIVQLDGEESHGAPPTSAFQLVPAPVTTPDIHNIPTGASSSTRFFARPEIQLTKLRQAKDSVDQLVSSAMILEIQNQTQLKSRISPFRYESRGSFQSKGSLQSSPSRQRGHPSPLHQEKVRVASSLEILKEPSYQLAPNSKLPGAPSLPPKTKPLSFHRNSVGLPVGNQLPISEGETKPIQRNHTVTRLGAGIQLMACQKVTKSTHELQVCSSLAEIEEKMESSAKKHLKKQIDHSDVATRAKMFSSIQCPSCQRKFGPRAADDHIRYCTQKNELQKFAPKQVPARPPSRVVASVLGQSKDPSPVRRIDPKKVQARVDTGLKQPPIALFRREQGAQPHSQSFFARAQTTGRTSKLMRSQADLTPQLIPQSKQINSQSLIKPPSPAHASTLTALRGARTNSFNPKNTVQQHVNRMSTWNAKHKVAHQHTLSGGASPRRMPHTGMPYAAYAPKQQSSARQQYQPMYKPDAVQAPRSLKDSNTSIPKPKPIPYQTLFKPMQDINESAGEGEAHSKFCTNCGSKFENTTHKFCGDCGTSRQMI